MLVAFPDYMEEGNFPSIKLTLACLASQLMAHETAGLWPGELTRHVAQHNVNCSIQHSTTRALSSHTNEILEQLSSVY